MEIEKIAFEFALKWHNGHFRKDNQTPYINHPIEVVKTLKAWGVDNKEVIAVAYLHDVLEDTAYPREKLAAEFPTEVMEAVDLLTHEEGVPYLVILLLSYQHRTDMLLQYRRLLQRETRHQNIFLPP